MDLRERIQLRRPRRVLLSSRQAKISKVSVSSAAERVAVRFSNDVAAEGSEGFTALGRVGQGIVPAF